MSHKHLIWEEVSQLAARIAENGSLGAAEMSSLVEQLGRLAKVQFKANALQEAALRQQKDTFHALQVTMARQEEMIAALQKSYRKDIDLGRHDLLLAMLPVVDGLEASLANASRQMDRLPQEGEPHAALSTWLDGLRLSHQRMLDVLAQADVEPIVAVGQPFDPRLHVATGVDTSGRAPLGSVVSEEQRGYRTQDGVLRYAEVVVSRPASSPAVSASPRVAAPPEDATSP